MNALTEAEWQAGTDPLTLLRFLKTSASPRKLRLFAVACCRLQGHTLERCGAARSAVRLAERLAEGRAGSCEVENLRDAAPATVDTSARACLAAIDWDAFGAAEQVVFLTADAAEEDAARFRPDFPIPADVAEGRAEAVWQALAEVENVARAAAELSGKHFHAAERPPGEPPEDATVWLTTQMNAVQEAVRRAVQFTARFGHIEPGTRRPHKETAVDTTSLAATAHQLLFRASVTVRTARFETARRTLDDRRTAAVRAVRRSQVRLLREVFGNPLRECAVHPQWLARDGGRLAGWAARIDEERQFDELPFLADALEDAGCPPSALLEHCRQAPAAHVRGCWALDRLLGKG